jgi:hypothetical protein
MDWNFAGLDNTCSHEEEPNWMGGEKAFKGIVGKVIRKAS